MEVAHALSRAERRGLIQAPAGSQHLSDLLAYLPALHSALPAASPISNRPRPDRLGPVVVPDRGGDQLQEGRPVAEIWRHDRVLVSQASILGLEFVSRITPTGSAAVQRRKRMGRLVQGNFTRRPFGSVWPRRKRTEIDPSARRPFPHNSANDCVFESCSSPCCFTSYFPPLEAPHSDSTTQGRDSGEDAGKTACTFLRFKRSRTAFLRGTEPGARQEMPD